MGQTDDQQKEFFTVKELAEWLGVNPNTIYRMVDRGEIPCHQIGRAKRFRRPDIEAFLSRCRGTARGAERGE